MTVEVLLHSILKHEHQDVYIEIKGDGVVKVHLVDGFFRHIGGFNLFYMSDEGISFDGSVGKWRDQTSNLEMIEVDEDSNDRLKVIGIDII